MDELYGRNCELRKTIEEMRNELNKLLTEHPLNQEKIMSQSTLLDKLIIKCMKCDIEECRYNQNK